ncbi:hypothetical protein HGG72_22505 [Ochrobactrum pecoris]|uniref:Uncharacterized protein n=1 Tax=Brucella pecoris TaxID=867683 RepID=A0A5C5CKD0_9HYPH|nr:hypothetical protein [Brucella pecoris]MBB4091687.1 hypothetical protein [Brucella pecoris]NKW82442.1 hypothetical protein [Brucella pecoris]TNV11773.1 hypothetical protein FIB18_13260 [Brucella pecoris]
MKKYLLGALFVVLATPSFACTAEEVQAKAMEVATKMQEVAAANPQKAQEIAQKMSGAQTQATSDLEGACKVYDDLLADLNS